MIDINVQESFISFDEYITVLEFEFIQKHEYQVCALEMISETIIKLQLIDMSDEDECFMMSFVIFSKTLMMCLQLNDRIMINFDLSELSLTSHWHVRVLSSVMFMFHEIVSVIVTCLWIHFMNDDKNLTDAAHWTDDSVSTFATDCNNHDFWLMKSEVVIIENDESFNDACFNMKA